MRSSSPRIHEIERHKIAPYFGVPLERPSACFVVPHFGAHARFAEWISVSVGLEVRDGAGLVFENTDPPSLGHTLIEVDLDLVLAFIVPVFPFFVQVNSLSTGERPRGILAILDRSSIAEQPTEGLRDFALAGSTFAASQLHVRYVILDKQINPVTVPVDHERRR